MTVGDIIYERRQKELRMFTFYECTLQDSLVHDSQKQQQCVKTKTINGMINIYGIIA